MTPCIEQIQPTRAASPAIQARLLVIWHDEGGIDAATAPAHSRRTMPAGFYTACRVTEFYAALLLRFLH